MHDLGDLDWLSLTFSATFGVCRVFSRLDSFSPSQHKVISMLVDCFLSLWFRGLINLGGIL